MFKLLYRWKFFNQTYKKELLYFPQVQLCYFLGRMRMTNLAKVWMGEWASTNSEQKTFSIFFYSFKELIFTVSRKFLWIRFLQFRGNRPGSGCDAAKWKLRKFRAFQIVFCLNNLSICIFSNCNDCCISNCICRPSFLVLLNVSPSFCVYKRSGHAANKEIFQYKVPNFEILSKWNAE